MQNGSKYIPLSSVGNLLLTISQQSSGKWPAGVERAIKRLMIQGELTAYHKRDPDNEEKMSRLFDKILTVGLVDFKGWKREVHEKRLWQLFVAKVGRIRAEMLRDGEVRQTAEGYKLSTPPFAKLQTPLPISVEEPPAQPPASSFPNVRYRGAVGLWNEMDADTQMKMFRKQIRTAKDPKRLVHEWDQLLKEVRQNEVKEVTRADEATIPQRFAHDWDQVLKDIRRNQVKEVIRADQASRAANHMDNVNGAQGRSLPATPQSLFPLIKPTQPKDLKTIIEDRIREVKLKRELGKRKLAEQDEDAGRKRVKAYKTIGETFHEVQENLRRRFYERFRSTSQDHPPLPYSGPDHEGAESAYLSE